MFLNFFEKKEHLAVIAGCSNFGSNLAGMLCENNWDVVVIDKDKNAFCKLSDNFSGLTIEGDACDTAILESALIKKSLICIASTESDNVNSLISQIAAKVYNVANVYARINDNVNSKALKENRIHIICPADLCVAEFEKQSCTLSIA